MHSQTFSPSHTRACRQPAGLPFRLCWVVLLSVLACPPVAEANNPVVDQALRQALLKAVGQAQSFEDRFDAQVWLLDMSNRTSRYVTSAQERLHILRAAHREARRAKLPPDLVLGVIHTESLFQRFAISVAGAQGLMQIMPFWKKEIGRPNDNLMDIDTNLRYGCTILSYYLKKAKGNISEALARYNGSYGRMVYPEKVFKAQLRYQD